jgi:hypothetical protein
MQLVPAHVDQPTRVRKPPPFQSRRHALVGSSDQDQKQDSDAGGDEHAADNRRHGRGSGLRLGQAVFLDAGVKLSARQAEQLRGPCLVVTRLRQCLDDERTLDGVEVDPARGSGALFVSDGAGALRVALTGRCSLRIYPPSARITARSIALRSSRTLPGHG